MALREIKFLTKDGVHSQSAECLGEWGMLKPKDGIFIIVHLPTGLTLSWGFSTSENALGALQEIVKLRNNWDLTIPSILKYVPQLREILSKFHATPLHGVTETRASSTLNGYDGNPMEI